MADRKNRPGKDVERPESKPERDDIGEPSPDRLKDEPAARIRPEEMAPVDPATLGPEPIPGAAGRPLPAGAASTPKAGDDMAAPDAAPDAATPGAAASDRATPGAAAPDGAADAEAGRDTKAPTADPDLPSASDLGPDPSRPRSGPDRPPIDADPPAADAAPSDPLAPADTAALPPAGAEGTAPGPAGPASSATDDAGHAGGAGDDQPPRAGALHDEHEEPAGRSVASILLGALLLLIAGAAIGIWAAPRLAPNLPAGMAPVAAWLSPGGGRLEERVASTEAETRAEIAALRAEIERLDGALAEAAAAEPGEDPALAELEQRLAGRVAAVEDDLAGLDGAETRDRVSRLEAAVEGQQETLAAIRDQFAGIEVENGAVAQFDAYEAELQGLRGEIRDVAGQVGTLSRRIDEVAAQAERQVELARAQVEEIEAEATAGLTRAEIEADLATIRSALASGQPYDEAAGRLATQPDLAIPASLYEAAPEGVPTMSELRQRFPDAANAAIRADVQAGTDDSLWGRMRGFAEAQVATRSLEPRPGLDTDSVLSRMEHALRQDDLDTALAEAEGLSPEAEAAMSDWLEAARTRHAAASGFEQLQADLTATN